MIQIMARFDANKSTKGASKLRRDLINAEIANLRDLLPLPPSTRQRLSQLQLMALVCVYVRKTNYFQQAFKCHTMNLQSTTPSIGFSKALNGFLMMMTQNGKLLYISDNAAEYLGHSMEDLLIHGDSVYDIIDKQDHAGIQAEMVRKTTTEYESRMFVCRINVTRNARRQMRFGDQKVVLVQGHFLSFLPLCSRNEPVFIATCTPIAMPETRECVVQGSTNVFTSIHSMDMKFMYLDRIGEHHLGYLWVELQGVSWYKLLHWECMQEAQLKHRLITQSEQERACIILVRVQRRTGDWIWMHCVLQVRDNVENNQHSVIVCTNQILNDQEAQVMRNSAWLYEYYTVHNKLQCGVNYNAQTQPRCPSAASSTFQASVKTPDKLTHAQVTHGTQVSHTPPYYYYQNTMSDDVTGVTQDATHVTPAYHEPYARKLFDKHEPVDYSIHPSAAHLCSPSTSSRCFSASSMDDADTMDAYTRCHTINNAELFGAYKLPFMHSVPADYYVTGVGAGVADGACVADLSAVGYPSVEVLKYHEADQFQKRMEDSPTKYYATPLKGKMKKLSTGSGGSYSSCSTAITHDKDSDDEVFVATQWKTMDYDTKPDYCDDVADKPMAYEDRNNNDSCDYKVFTNLETNNNVLVRNREKKRSKQTPSDATKPFCHSPSIPYVYSTNGSSHLSRACDDACERASTSLPCDSIKPSCDHSAIAKSAFERAADAAYRHATAATCVPIDAFAVKDDERGAAQRNVAAKLVPYSLPMQYL